MSRSKRRARRAHRGQGDPESARSSFENGFLPLAASLSAALGALFLLCALCVLMVWPPAAAAREKGFLAAAREQAKLSTALLREMTLPQFVAKVAARLRGEGVVVSIEGDGTRLVLEGDKAQFDRSSAALRPPAAKTFESFSRALAWGMNCHVAPTQVACGEPVAVRCEEGYAPFEFSGLVLAGHADGVPYRANRQGNTNETLSRARGLSAKAAVDGCLPSGAVGIKVEAFGASEPRVKPAVDRRNRRVEIRFVP